MNPLPTAGQLWRLNGTEALFMVHGTCHLHHPDTRQWMPGVVCADAAEAVVRIEDTMVIALTVWWERYTLVEEAAR